jgi:AcrR family transcriptional regulator
MARNTDERREQIKRAALKVFARRGVEGARMSAIANEAQVSLGLFYRYFPSKDELYATLVEELLDAASAEIEQLVRLPGTPLEQLRAFTAGMLADEHRHAFTLIHQARLDANPPSRVKKALRLSSETALIERLRPVFVRGQRAGQFVAGDPTRLLSDYFSVVNSLLLAEPPVLPTADFLMRLIAA